MGWVGVSATIPVTGYGFVADLVNEAPGRIVVATERNSRSAVEMALGAHGRRIGEVSGGDRIVLATASGGTDTVDHVLVDIGLVEAVAAFNGAASAVGRT